MHSFFNDTECLFGGHDYHLYSASNFTGKELDEETGYGYFGARYYDATLLTSWTAVDPMSDKYPNISPYAYCAWNPVKLVDPDGKDIVTLVDGKQCSYDFSRNIFVDNAGEECHNDFTTELCKSLKTIGEGTQGQEFLSYFNDKEHNVYITKNGNNGCRQKTFEAFGYTNIAFVTWNPNKDAALNCGQDETSMIGTSYVSLAHEMQHAKNRIQGRPLGTMITIGNENCSITDESSAMLMENIIRCEHGLEQRKKYASNAYNNIVAPQWDGVTNVTDLKLLNYVNGK